MSIVNQIPYLRFPEFRETWTKVKLKDVSQYFNGGSFEGDVRESGKYELVTLKSIDTLGNLVSSERYIDTEVKTLSKGSLVMILSEQAPGLLGMTALIPKDNFYVLNQRVAEIRPNYSMDSFFLSMAINRNQRYFSKMGAGMKVQNISKPNVQNYEFFQPHFEEQQKIASFLSSVNKKIELLKQKKDLLEKYKKGVMQQIFSQQIRFKDDDGNEYPDWEEKELGEIGSIINGLTYSPKDIDDDGVLVLRSSNVQNRILTFDDNVYVDVDEGNFNPVKENDILICVRNGSKRLIGKNALINKQNEGIAFGAFMAVYRSDYNRFLFHLFDTDIYKKQVHRNLGATINSINGSDLKKFKLHLPSDDEQEKISTFLSSIDDKIELVNTQIDNTEAFKKGLLQQMFV